MSAFGRLGTHNKPNLTRDLYESIKRQVIVAVNVCMWGFEASGGKKGIDPNCNYSIAYDKKRGRVVVNIWKGVWNGNEKASNVEVHDANDILAGAADLKQVLKEGVVM